MIHNTLGIPSLGATGDRWIDAITGQHRVLSKGGAWENIDSKLTHPDEVIHEVIQPEIVGESKLLDLPEKSAYEHVRYSHSRPDALTSPAIERALSESIIILDLTEVSHEEQTIEPVRAEAIEQHEGSPIVAGHGVSTAEETDGNHGGVSGIEPEQEAVGQIQGTLVDVGIDTDPIDVI